MIQLTFSDEQLEQEFLDKWFMDRSQDEAPIKLKHYVEVE